jgi:hypothetical protein
LRSAWAQIIVARQPCDLQQHRLAGSLGREQLAQVALQRRRVAEILVQLGGGADARCKAIHTLRDLALSDGVPFL